MSKKDIKWLSIFIVALFFIHFLIPQKNAQNKGIILNNQSIEISTGAKIEFPQRNKWSVALFWSTQCGACLNELQILYQHLKHHTKENSFEIYALSINDSHKSILQFAQSNINLFPHAPAPQNLLQKLSISMIPALFFINPEGKIMHQHQGILTYEDIKEIILKQ